MKDRKHQIEKIIKYVKQRGYPVPHLDEAVYKYVADLDDQQLSNLVRVTGTQAQKKERVGEIRAWLKSDPHGVLTFMIQNPSFVMTNDEFENIEKLLEVLHGLGHEPIKGSVYWEAHYKALLAYDSLDNEDPWSQPWTYNRHEQLRALVDNHPEDVDAIFVLRNKLQLKVTEELLAEYKQNHAALAGGFL